MNLDLEGQTALVTGASRGIGAAIAVALAGEGMDVALVARDEAALAATAARVEALGRRAVIVPADLRQPDACAAAVERAVSALGRLDVVANSAGATKRGDFFSLSDEDWEDGYALKVFGTMRICRAAWPHLARTGNGRIVTVAGAAVRTPTRDFAIGSSVNAALLNLMKALSDRGRTEGVRINVVNPGYVETDRLRNRLAANARDQGTTPDAVAAALLAEVGLARFAQPEEIGSLVAYLVSPMAAYIEGTSIDIDGGWTKGV